MLAYAIVDKERSIGLVEDDDAPSLLIFENKQDAEGCLSFPGETVVPVEITALDDGVILN